MLYQRILKHNSHSHLNSSSALLGEKCVGDITSDRFFIEYFRCFTAKFWRIDVIYSSDAGLKVHSRSQCWVFPFWAVVET